MADVCCLTVKKDASTRNMTITSTIGVKNIVLILIGYVDYTLKVVKSYKKDFDNSFFLYLMTNLILFL
jgi:hypothetical protein